MTNTMNSRKISKNNEESFIIKLVYVCSVPIVWTLGDLSPVIWLLLNWFDSLCVGGLFFHLDHRGTGFGCG